MFLQIVQPPPPCGYATTGRSRLARLDYHGRKEVPKGNLPCDPEGRWIEDSILMIDLKYSLTIEATEDPTFFSFYSAELEGFTGEGRSVEDCLYHAKWGMIEQMSLLEEQGLAVPPPNLNPRIIIENASPGG